MIRNFYVNGNRLAMDNLILISQEKVIILNITFTWKIMQKFDAIIIGTGQAGPSMAARCAAEGLKTAVIEKNKFGGTCVNDGCTPTKTLVASAKAAHMARS